MEIRLKGKAEYKLVPDQNVPDHSPIRQTFELGKFIICDFKFLLTAIQQYYASDIDVNE